MTKEAPLFSNSKNTLGGFIKTWRVFLQCVLFLYYVYIVNDCLFDRIFSRF